MRLGANTRGLVALLVVLAALAATASACGGNDEDAGAAATTAADVKTAPADQKWKKIVPGGDCECADGSEFAFWERRADPTKVVLFLDAAAPATRPRPARSPDLAPAERRTTTGRSPTIRRRTAGSSTSPAPRTRSATTASFPCPPAPVTRTSATSPASTRNADRRAQRLRQRHGGAPPPRRALPRRRPGRRRRQVRSGRSPPHLRRPRVRSAPHAKVSVFGGQSGHVPDGGCSC